MLVFGGVLMVAAAGIFGFLAQDAIAFYKSPTELRAESYGPKQLLRLGGVVVEGSVGKDGTINLFELTDNNLTVQVAFEGVLPDLFREGQMAVTEGYWTGERFEASEVLAKHDENYMPREVVEKMHEKGAEAGS